MTLSRFSDTLGFTKDAPKPGAGIAKERALPSLKRVDCTTGMNAAQRESGE